MIFYGFVAEIDIIYLEEICVSHKWSDDAPGSLILLSVGQRAYNESLPFQEIPTKLAELAARLAKPAMQEGTFKAEAAIVNFYGPGKILRLWYGESVTMLSTVPVVAGSVVL